MRTAALLALLAALPFPAAAQTSTSTPAGGGVFCISCDYNVSGQWRFARPPTGVGAGATSTFDVTTYGAIVDDGLDDSTAVIAAITAASLTGGTVYFPAGTYRIDSRLAIPNDGDTVPKQRPIKLQGAGALYSGRGATSAPYGGTILDLRYAGSPAKIDTRGLGLLEITGLTLEDTTDGTTPFIQTTNTTLLVNHSGFYGKTGGLLAVQDAIVLGGTSADDDGSATSYFQGYGTVIDSNYFGQIRRGVYGRSAVNGVVVTNNFWWANCGGSAAFESDGFAYNNAGWYVAGNVIEELYYTYAFFLTKTNNSTFVGNNLYDTAAATTAHYRFDLVSSYNTVIAGYHTDTITAFSEDASVANTNTYLNAHQSQLSKWIGPWTFKSPSVKFDTGAGSGPLTLDTTGNYWYNQLNQSDGSRWYFKWTPNGGSTEDIAYVQRASSTDTRIVFLGSANSRVSGSSQLEVFSAAGQALYLGDATNKSYMLNGTFHSNTVPSLKMKATGTMEWSSTAAASGGSDTGLTRSAAGEVEVNSGVAGTLRDLKARSVRGTAVAFASLPASPVEGMLVGVTDSNTATWGATVAGGGANHILAYYNGTNWTVAGK